MTRLGDGRWSNYTVTDSGCWEWLGYADKNGYARIYDPARPKGSQVQWAHRAFWEREHGLVPAGLELDHTCCNTICVNPAHLDSVTRAEHVRRTFARLGKDDKHALAAHLRILGLTYAEIAEAVGYLGQQGAHDAVLAAITKGLVDPQSIPAPPRLTPAEREDIRTLNSLGVPQRELAAWFRVDNSAISRVCNGRTPRRAAA